MTGAELQAEIERRAWGVKDSSPEAAARLSPRLPPNGKASSSTCIKFEELATKIMRDRQAGTPVGQVLARTGGDDLLRKVVLEAYDTPRFGSDKYQQRAITEFANKWAVECYKSLEQR